MALFQQLPQPSAVYVSSMDHVWDADLLEWVRWDGDVTLTAAEITIGVVDQGAAGVSAWKVDGSAVTQPVSGTFFQATQPVSGPLTDAQLRASAVPVSSATLATQATLASSLTELQSILAKLNASIAVTGTVTANAGTNLNTSALALESSLSALNTKIPSQVDSRLPTTTGVNYGSALDIANDPIYPMGGITTGFTWVGLAVFDAPLAGTEYGLAIRFAGTQDVDIKANTIGLATGAKQDTLQTATDAINTKTPALGQALAAASTPVVLTAAQISTLTPPAAIVGFALESGGNLATIAATDFATEAKQDTEITALGTLNTSVNTLLKPASTLTAVGTINAQATSYGKTLTYVPVAQGAAGTTQLAAASASNKHKIIAAMLTMSAAGTLKFLDGSGDLTGAMDLGAAGGFVLPAALLPFQQTATNSALSITTTVGAAKGVVVIVTEP